MLIIIEGSLDSSEVIYLLSCGTYLLLLAFVSRRISLAPLSDNAVINVTLMLKRDHLVLIE